MFASKSPVSAQDKAVYQGEVALEELLAALPRPTVSGHLASRVLREIERESSAGRSSRVQKWSSSLEGLWARITPQFFARGLGVSVLLVTVVLQVSVHQRRVMAREVAELSAVTAVPGVDVLRNFDAITALGAGVQVHPTDIDLMAAMVAIGN